MTDMLEVLTTNPDLPGELISGSLDYNLTVIDSLADIGSPKGEYMMVLEHTSSILPPVLRQNLNLFMSNPLFRKMAMVSSVVNGFDNPEKVYGYFINNNLIYPSLKPSSNQVYAVQIGYFYGAVIRTKVFRGLGHRLTGDAIQDSTLISLGLWNSGNRVYVNPSTTYITDYSDYNRLHHTEVSVLPKLAQTFRREQIR